MGLEIRAKEGGGDRHRIKDGNESVLEDETVRGTLWACKRLQLDAKEQSGEKRGNDRLYAKKGGDFPDHHGQSKKKRMKKI